MTWSQKRKISTGEAVVWTKRGMTSSSPTQTERKQPKKKGVATTTMREASQNLGRRGIRTGMSSGMLHTRIKRGHPASYGG